MRTFVLTSKNFEGEVFFHYVNERLVKFSCIDATLNLTQYAYIVEHLPLTVEWLEKHKSPTSKIEEINTDITFDMFWKKWLKKWTSYNAGSRIPAEKAFSKLTQKERNDAYNNVDRYASRIKPGCTNCDGSTYLNQKRWIV